jgi:CDP-diacylglycerol---glycerol-3-phosphate 3-phosphatidyltransferase
LNWPNLVTFLRLLLIPLLVILLYIPGINYYWVAALFLLISAGDALDGYLARKLNQVTELGKYIDPIVDKILIISVLVVLIEKSLVSAVPVIILICREILVSGWRILLAKKSVVLAAGYLGKIKMVVEVIAVTMLLLGLRGGLIMLWTAVILSLASALEYFIVNSGAIEVK